MSSSMDRTRKKSNSSVIIPQEEAAVREGTVFVVGIGEDESSGRDPSVSLCSLQLAQNIPHSATHAHTSTRNTMQIKKCPLQ